MQSQQPRRQGLDHLDIDHDVAPLHHLAQSDLGDARGILGYGPLAHEPPKRGDDFYRSQRPHHHCVVGTEPRCDTRRTFLMDQERNNRRAVPEPHRPSSRSRRRAATTSALTRGLPWIDLRESVPLPRRTTPRRSRRSNHSASSPGTGERVPARSTRAMTRSRSHTRMDTPRCTRRRYWLRGFVSTADLKLTEE